MGSDEEHIEPEGGRKSDQYFEPVVELPPVTISTAEENETCIFMKRAKLFRFDRIEDPPEWKERGSGLMKILVHNVTGQYRLLMRRYRTFKVCANHFITPAMELRSNCNNNRAFVWQTLADFADEILKPEALGIRFANADIASTFKEMFNQGRETKQHTKENTTEAESHFLAHSMEKLNVNRSLPAGDNVQPLAEGAKGDE